MKILEKTIALLTPYERKRGLLVLLMVIGMALFEAVGVVSVMPFLAVLGNPEMIDTNSTLNAFYVLAQTIGINTNDDFLIILGLGSFVLFIVSTMYRILTQYMMNRYIEMCRHSIATRLLEAYLRQPYSFFLSRHSADLSKTILSEVDRVVGNVINPVYNMAAYGLITAVITILLFVVDPLLAVSTAGLLGGLYLAVFLIVKNKLASLGGKQVIANKDRFIVAGEALGGIKDIKLLARERSYLDQFARPSLRMSQAKVLAGIIKLIPHSLIEAMMFGAILLISIFLIIGSGGLSSNSLGQILPVLGLYAFSAYRLKPAIQIIFDGMASLQYGEVAVDRLYADLHPDNPPEQLPTISPAPLRAQSTIALQDLSYAYPNSAKPSLINLNLDIPVGSSLGLIGSTGAGKTTLVDVLLGLLRPTEGGIAVDDLPVTDAMIRAWQRSLGYVPQEIFLTDTTIAQNIALGIPENEIDQDQVEYCARMAQLHDFIVHDLSEQYQTLVGERGVRLSGGQRQRIGIARALYHNPEVLVFDEATSALDTVTEQAVMDAIDVLAHQKTIILIAHRLSTVKNCDQIVLLERGEIKEKGRYDELVYGSAQFRSMAGVH